MKKCPTCRVVYRDNEQTFCLNDGSLLVNDDEQETVVIAPPRQSAPQPLYQSAFSSDAQSPTVKQGVSPVFAYLAVGLVALLVGGGAVAWIMSSSPPVATENKAANQPDTSANGADGNVKLQKTEGKEKPLANIRPVKTNLAENAAANASRRDEEEGELATANTKRNNDAAGISAPCRAGQVSFFKGGNFRSSPRHSADEANVIAVIDPGSALRILGTANGEARESTGNTVWYRVKFTGGSCRFDQRKTKNVFACDIRNLSDGYVNADLVDPCG